MVNSLLNTSLGKALKFCKILLLKLKLEAEAYKPIILPEGRITVRIYKELYGSGWGPTRFGHKFSIYKGP